MSEGDATPTADLPETPIFATTRWTVVMNAGDKRSAAHDDALAQLCRNYWYPLYAFARRQGASPHDAQDLAQEFFARLLERDYLHRADPTKGRFRWFLLGAFKHFLSHQRDHDRAAKRGGGHTHISLDEALAGESRYQCEPATSVTPETLFERAWASTLLDRVKEQVRTEYEKAEKLDRFQHLQCFLPGAYEKKPYPDVARELQITEGAVRVELHRLKNAYRRVLRNEIAHTVATPLEIDDEVRHLIKLMQA